MANVKFGMFANIKLTEISLSQIDFRLAYFKTFQAMFKIIQLIFAIVAIGIIGVYYNSGYRMSGDLFFLMMIATFFICTFCLFISEFFLWNTIRSPTKSAFEIVFFCFSAILLFTSSIHLLVSAIMSTDSNSGTSMYIASSIIGLLLTALYVADMILSLYSIHNASIRKTSSRTITSNRTLSRVTSNRQSLPSNQINPFSADINTET